MGTITTVAVAGGSGFVGREVVRQLVEAGYQARVLTRDAAHARRVLPRMRVTIVEGDSLDPARVETFLGGAQACINLVGILREKRGEGTAETFDKAHVRTPRLLVDRCKAMGIRRFVQMSALGVSDVGVSEYQRTKWAGELIVRRSGLEWTIFRPSLIHGPEGEFVKMAKDLVSGHQAPWLFIPYFSRSVEDKRVPLGSMEQADPLIQPVHVRDVARAYVLSLAKPEAIGEVYNLAGSQVLSWPEMLTIMRDHLHGANHRLHPHGVPAAPAAWAAKGAALVGLGSFLPFDEGMARMGAEDSVAEREKVRQELGLETRPFQESFLEYAASV